ncbi:two-component system KDP operon response regulator KdpE [Dongia mobilis]|uniref:Two-component system KDP operon response regulator KdpE n=1 Tax=Dongia mobilis TaxID=578943 RepID=A0A4R6WNK2_9PROT|nr:response regulator transcription factor [Dongia mobilis]TDQ77729.1 two-component system KDP operon response regulator KdpE [Dongia mobilis]
MTALRVLVIDDEIDITGALQPSLEAEGYQVVSAANAESGLDLLQATNPDAMILDLGLPDLDGKEVIQRVREWSDVPIIVLSARHMEEEKIAALDFGANDYINKPFAIGELLARLRVALRLRQSRDKPAANFQGAGLAIDFPSRSVTVRGQEVKLTPKEYDLLRALAQHAGQVMTHNQLLAFVWGSADLRDSQTLRVMVAQLRQKIEASPRNPKLILTEPGVGYRLKVDDEG